MTQMKITVTSVKVVMIVISIIYWSFETKRVILILKSPERAMKAVNLFSHFTKPGSAVKMTHSVCSNLMPYLRA